MAKLKAVKIGSGDRDNKLIFKIDININSEGQFTTTLPQDIAEIFSGANISLERNRLGNKGFFESSTYDGLLLKIKNVTDEYHSRELIDNELLIKYAIQTMASYCINDKGEVVPNGKNEWTNLGGNYEWRSGTVSSNATNPTPFGFLIYAKPFYKKTYKYKSGIEKIEYEELHFNSEKQENKPYLYWLSEVCSSRPPSSAQLQEIEYTEARAKFFVDMIKSVCALNEKIIDHLDPESIKLIVETGRKLIG